MRTRTHLAAIGLGSALLAGCGGAATSSVKPPVAVAPVKITVADAKADKAETPEDALLARLDQMQKIEFLRPSQGRGAKRAKVAPTAFKLSSLPVAKLGPMPTVEEYKPMSVSPPRPNPKLGAAEPEITIAPWDPKEKIVPGAMHNVRLTVREPAKGVGDSVGFSQLVTVEQLRRAPTGSAHEMVEHCGDGYGYDRWVPIRWNRLSSQSDGLHVGVGDAVFDRVACSVHTIQHVETRAAPLVAGGVMYGFRACGETCAARESLVIVMPHVNSAASASLGGDPIVELGLFTVVDIPIERGGGGSLVTSLAGYDLTGWHKGLTGVDLVASDNVLMGVEITQSVREPEPFAIAYVEVKDPLAVGPPRPAVIDKLANILIR